MWCVSFVAKTRGFYSSMCRADAKISFLAYVKQLKNGYRYLHPYYQYMAWRRLWAGENVNCVLERCSFDIANSHKYGL